MKTKTLHQTIHFNAPPKKVYELIMDAKNHSAFTGSDVRMSKAIGGKFEAFDGYIHGHNIELQEGMFIQQAWHFKEDGWTDDHFSICTFRFRPDKGGTELKFTQQNIPLPSFEALKKGWHTFYWRPMKQML